MPENDPLGLTERELTGLTRSHIVDLDEPRCSLHRAAVGPFRALRAAAFEAGIDLVPLSSYRDFQRQATIWNAKFRGERPLLDAEGGVLEGLRLSPAERVAAILTWSALPGASRHHWGTEIDVVDGAVLRAGYDPQLLPEEFAFGGAFEALDRWLSERLGEFGFYRPYVHDRGGVHPEPWHISYAPVAQRALDALTPEVLWRALEPSDIEGLEVILPQLRAIHARYVQAVDSPSPGAAIATRLS